MYIPKCQKSVWTSRRSTTKTTHNLATTEVMHTIGDHIECEKLNSFRRLVTLTANVVKAVKMFKRKIASWTSSPPLSTEGLSDAEHEWISDSWGNLEHTRLFNSTYSWIRMVYGTAVEDYGHSWHSIFHKLPSPIALKSLPDPSCNQLTPTNACITCILDNDVKETFTKIKRRFWIMMGWSLVQAISH